MKKMKVGTATSRSRPSTRRSARGPELPISNDRCYGQFQQESAHCADALNGHPPHSQRGDDQPSKYICIGSDLRSNQRRPSTRFENPAQPDCQCGGVLLAAPQDRDRKRAGARGIWRPPAASGTRDPRRVVKLRLYLTYPLPPFFTVQGRSLGTHHLRLAWVALQSFPCG
jgi:hypothetical protein